MASIPVIDLVNSSDNLQSKIVRRQQYEKYIEAYDFINAAKAAADKILAEARQQSEQIIQQSHEKSKQEHDRQVVKQQIELVGKSIEYFSTIEKTVLDLVIGTVKQVISQMPPEQIFVSAVKKGLAFMHNQKQVYVTVAPGDVRYVKASIKEMLANFPGVNLIEVLSDARLQRGSCIVSSDVGAVDTGVFSQISVIEADLRETFGKRGKKAVSKQDE